MSRPQNPEAVLRKNQIITLHITGMTAEGNGVGHFCGLAVFVPMTAVGDTAEVRIVKVLKSYAFGIIEQLTEPAAGRITPACPVFRQCGGCVFQHVDYQTELQYKEQLVRDAFQRIGRLEPVFETVCGHTERDGYRNKAQYPVAESDGHLVCGFYAKRSHRVVPFDACQLHPPVFAELLHVLLPLLERSHVSAYREETHTGELRHIYLRRGYHSGEIMLCLVTRVSLRKKITAVLPELQAAFPMLRSITESVNPERTNVILGRQVTVLAGESFITDTMCGREICISPQSFYQINTAQAEQLYGIAKDYADLHGTETLLDLYCGAGTVGLSMADACGKLIGVEIIPQAVENAKENAARNGVENARFICGDAGTVAAEFAAEGASPDVIVVDPPRKGCDALTVDSVVQMQPQRVVMISCNPATAARDAAMFAERGYRVEKVRAVDMFPNTAHVECVVLLSREKS
ncbi:MAG: 23S rRNA (uracil(1939)-C(5))-methyltransferase RlmD [Oscillospiraceae bacterium]|nr:23S rRNA (uracil(1939)-C(5))-methyltransferase RlmD [Oscillospiraceae bacterium]